MHGFPRFTWPLGGGSVLCTVVAGLSPAIAAVTVDTVCSVSLIKQVDFPLGLIESVRESGFSWIHYIQPISGSLPRASLLFQSR